MTISKPVLTGGAVIGTSTVAVGGYLLASGSDQKETIYEKVKDYAIEKTGNFSENGDQKKSKIPSDLNQKIIDSSSLGAGCNEQYSIETESISEEEQQKIISLVNLLCTYSIGYKLGDDKLSKINEENGGKTKSELLLSYEKFREKTTDLNAEIEAIRGKITSIESDGTHLKKGCEEKQTEGYLGKGDQTGKLAKTFCSEVKVKDSTFRHYLADREELNEEWDEKIEEIIKKTEGSSPINEEKLKSQLENSSLNQEEKRRILKNFCKETYELKANKPTIAKEIPLTLKFEILCSLSIRRKLSNKAIDTSEKTTESDGKHALEKLKTDKDFEETKLPQELKDLKKGSDSSDGTKLKDGCERSYRERYDGKEDIVGKLVNSFCVKS